MNLSLGETVPSQCSSTQVSRLAHKAAVDSALYMESQQLLPRPGNESSQNGLNRAGKHARRDFPVGAVYNDDSTRDASDTSLW